MSLFAAVWGLAFFEHVTRPPKDWRYVETGMSRSSVYSQLGVPRTTGENNATWDDDGLFGRWHLQVIFDRDTANTVETDWLWK